MLADVPCEGRKWSPPVDMQQHEGLCDFLKLEFHVLGEVVADVLGSCPSQLHGLCSLASTKHLLRKEPDDCQHAFNDACLQAECLRTQAHTDELLKLMNKESVWP